MKKLSQITSKEIMGKVNNVKTDEDMVQLGFTCKGHLCEYEGYESFYERLSYNSKSTPTST